MEGKDGVFSYPPPSPHPFHFLQLTKSIFYVRIPFFVVQTIDGPLFNKKKKPIQEIKSQNPDHIA